MAQPQTRLRSMLLNVSAGLDWTLNCEGVDGNIQKGVVKQLLRNGAKLMVIGGNSNAL